MYYIGGLRSLLGVLNRRAAEFSFSTPSAPPLTYTLKLTSSSEIRGRQSLKAILEREAIRRA